ncbi:hypothetical protein NIES4103_47820 [Nostoc sp. NIES-4103]|nr:hypothetical protein NIES4103_47820 [Nostoc sp. NIES-4103]
METKAIPVTIVYFGAKPNYLKFALQSAANFNKTVVLIGDQANKDLWKNHWDTTPIECSKYQAFLKNYIHMSTNSQEFEIACFKRFFYLEQWMEKNDIKKAFLLDGDIMTFANYSEQIDSVLLNNCIATLITPENQPYLRFTSSPHFSYWTFEGLKDFTNFCTEAYTNNILNKLQEKYQWHINNNLIGGICDMTLLYLWSEGNSQVASLNRVINDMTVDTNINVSSNYFDNEYRMQFGAKKLIFKKGIPYGYNQILNKEIQFLCIHCQGKAKALMKFFYYQKLRNFYYLPKIIAKIKLQLKSLIRR